jgi:zinc protease
VSFDAPKENLEAVWPLARAILAEPTFSNREIKLWRWDQRLWYTTQAPTSSRSVEGSLGSYGWFPSTHPYGVRPDLDALDAVKRNELLEAHAAIVASPVRVLVVGDVDATLTDAVVTLLDGLGGPGDPGADLTLGALKAPTLLAVDMPGDQATVSLRYAGPRLNTPDVAAFRAVDYALGGTFLARLNANLREERGLTYGIYSRYYADPGLGTWRTQVTVSADDAGEAITQIRAELDGILDGGASDVEIAAMTREWSAEWNQTLGTADDAMYAYADFADEGRTEAEARAELEALATLTGEQTRKAAATWLAADKPHLWIVVGPKDVLTEQLAATGLEPVWVDAEDAVLGDFADLAREAAP